jgi:hypothetical protein
MSADLFLDHDALRRLTGYAQKRRQVEQLRKMGVPFWVNGRGAPVVACSALQGSKPTDTPAPRPAWVPRVLRGGA